MKKIFTFLSFVLLLSFGMTVKAQTYCTPTYPTTCCMGFSNVQFGTINNNSTYGFGYENYTNLTPTDVFPGMTYTLTFTSRDYGMFVRVWVDVNIDYVFDATAELLYTSGASALMPGTYTVNITIPATAQAGLTRMRIVGGYEYSAQPNNPCGPIWYGDTEDYPINILPLSGFDLALTSVDYPVVFKVGNDSLKVTATNLAADPIWRFDMGYSLNGGVPQLFYAITPQDTLKAGKRFKYTFPTMINVPTKGNHQLKVWVSNANQIIPDDKPANDTLVLNFCTGMEGTYSIGAGGDFATFNLAYAELIKCGISGPITFNVAAGTYSESLVLKPVLGMSATNTVSFVGVNKATVLLNATGQAAIDFDGASYFRFRNMTINCNGGSNYAVLWFHNDAKYNIVENCILNAYALSTSTIYNNVLFSTGATSMSGNGNNGSYNKILNNSINGGYCGVAINGQATNVASNFDNIISGNIFHNQVFYGIYNRNGASGTVVELNRFGPTWRNTGAYGVYTQYAQRTRVNANIINPGRYGIFFSYECFQGGDSAFITNNMIYNFQDATYQQAIDLNWYCYNTHVMHNTVVINSNMNDFNNAYCIRIYYWARGSRVMNNIFWSQNDAYIMNVYYGDMSVNALDYNNYLYRYKRGVNRFYTFTPAMLFDNLNAFKNYTDNWIRTHDQNSLDNVDPRFISATDFHLNPTFKPITVNNDLGLWFDVDGDPRCIYATAIGADEPPFPWPKPKSFFYTEDTLCYGAPITFVNTADISIPQGYYWYMNGIFVSDDFHFTHTFSQPDIDTITLVTANCGGNDTFTRIVVIDAPRTAPTADFIAEMNQAEVGYPIMFYDLSTECPDEWEWTVYPDSVYDPVLLGKMPSHTFIYPSHANSQNAYISFDYAGSYKVCLKAKNIIGSDSLCKEDYIEVNPVQYMCFWPFEHRALTGTLYDDGGPFDYSNNQNCHILIEPCATELTLEFKSFNVAAGDFLRIFEGRNASGKPLWDIKKFPSGLSGQLADIEGIYTSKTGQMFIQWQTNASGVAPGFEAVWYSVEGNYPPPVAYFDAPDSVCEGQLVVFTDLSTGTNLSYSWDFDDDGFGDAFDANPTYQFPFAGRYKVTLSIEDCGGRDKYDTFITVVNVNYPPTADFEADVLRPVAGEDFVRFTDLSYPNTNNTLGCANMWEWTVSPDTMLDAMGLPVPSHIFVGGTSRNSQHPIIRFEDTGYYHITFRSGYNNNWDSVSKNNYIYAIKYCNTSVTNLNPDIGISRVRLADIDHISSIGKSAYSNFTNEAQTYLDLQGYYTLTVERSSTYNNMNRKAWIDWNQDGVFDASEEIGYESSARTASWSTRFQIPTTATEGATRLRIATSLDNLPNEPCGNRLYGEVEDYRVILRPDGTPPVITLNGSETVNLEQCECDYDDAGATAEDNIDGTVPATFHSTNFDCTKAGTYFYRYQAEDLSANVGTKDRIIIVNPDNVPPTISLLGVIFDTIEVLSVYTDPGYSFDDTCSGPDKVVITGSVDENVIGDYELLYTAYDNAGNTATATRIVSVRDMIDPTISLIGYSILDLEVHTPFVDPGVDVSDNFCAEEDLVVEVTGTVDISKLGIYTITYCVTDCNGNGPVCVQREVNVVDNTPPVIAIRPPYQSGDTIQLEVNHIFTLPYMTVTDNYYKTSDLAVSQSGTYITEFGAGVAANKLGYFTYVYSVQDQSGNSTSIDYVVYVVDTEAPVITLSGENALNLCRFQKLTPAQYASTVSDNFDQTVAIDTSGTYFTEYLVEMKSGLYTIVYDAKDNSGNEAVQKIRYINVEYCPWYSINENDLKERVKVYPNPTRGDFVAEINLPQASNLAISITNTLGQVISTTNYNNSSGGTFRFDLSSEADGVYFVHVKTENASTVLKLTLTK